MAAIPRVLGALARPGPSTPSSRKLSFATRLGRSRALVRRRATFKCPPLHGCVTVGRSQVGEEENVSSLTKTKPKKKKRVKDGVYESDVKLAKRSTDIEVSVLPTERELHRPPNWDELPQLSLSHYLRMNKANAFTRIDVWEPRKKHADRKLVVTDAKGQRAYISVPTEMENVVINEVLKSSIANVYKQAAAPPGRGSFAPAGLQFAVHPPPSNERVKIENDPMVIFGLSVASCVGLFLVVFFGLRQKNQMPSDQFTAMEFAKSRSDSRSEGKTDTKFADIAGQDETLEELKDIVAFLKDPKAYSKLGATPAKGVLLEGPPGTGKTLLAKAIAGEAGVPFYSMNGSEFVEMIVGVGAARVRDLFKRARVNMPCVVFVDELDALGGRRSDSSVMKKTGGGQEEREQTLNQLLTEMDGFEKDSGVVFLGATNRADMIDPALMRAGRFDRKIKVERPSGAGRAAILRIHARSKRIADDVDFDDIANYLTGFTGAQLENIMNEAALQALRSGSKEVRRLDIDLAIERTLAGISRPPLVGEVFEEQMDRIAFHELGVAVVATVLRYRNGAHESVDRVSLIPKGRVSTYRAALAYQSKLRLHPCHVLVDFLLQSWSRTIFRKATDEQYLMTTRAKLRDRLVVHMSGFASEEIFMGTASSLAIDSLQSAVNLATDITMNLDMSNKVGTTPYAERIPFQSTDFSGLDAGLETLMYDPYSSKRTIAPYAPSRTIARNLEAEKHRMIMESFDIARGILLDARPAVQELKERLLQQKVIPGPELERILREHGVISGELEPTAVKQ
eukprot:scaffold401_cov399-Prasinococcus_capsulatus_cf.AAC.14